MTRFLGILLELAAIFLDISIVYGTPFIYPPDIPNPPSRTYSEKILNSVHKREPGKASIAYFTNWGIYGSNFQPSDIVSSYLTHVLYSFADVDPSSGMIRLTDSYADEQKHYPGDSWNDPGNNLYGCFKQLYLMKLQRRNLKVLLSIGGWTYSQAGHFNFVTNPSARAAFVNSSVQMIEDYGFDGIDLDYEYPVNTAQGQGFADLLTELRRSLDNLQYKKGDSAPYLLSGAIAAGPANYQWYNVPQMDAAMNYWNLMAYDYAGSWSNLTDNQANVYGGELSGFSTDSALKWLIAKGATPAKITLGMPLYGRAFESTSGLGKPYNGVGLGTTEAGIYSYKMLPLAGALVVDNTTDISSYSYDSTKREFISYDTPNIVKLKTEYILTKGLAGSMFWELSTDKVGPESLVGTASQLLGTLDQSQNHISFPNSKFDNVRKNFGGSDAPSPPLPSGPPGSPSNGCNNITAWSPVAVYIGGQQVLYKGHLWLAKWWTQDEVPGTAEVWTDKGLC